MNIFYIKILCSIYLVVFVFSFYLQLFIIRFMVKLLYGFDNDILGIPDNVHWLYIIVSAPKIHVGQSTIKKNVFIHLL